MKKTRVIHIITRLDKGGSAETTLLIVSLMNHEKYEVFLVHGFSLESNMSLEENEAVQHDLAMAEYKGVRRFEQATESVSRICIKVLYVGHGCTKAN